MTQGALTDMGGRAGWGYKPLWVVAPRVVDKGFPEGQPLSVFLGAGVVPRSERADNHNELGADLSAYLHVLPGDLVFNKLRTWQGGLGVSQHEGIVSPAYFVCRPSRSVWPRFLHYLLLSAPYAAELTRLSKWMPPSQFDIPWEQLRTLPVLLPPFEEQRRIADFLDAQVELLDEIVRQRRVQLGLMGERLAAVGEQALWAGSQATTRGRLGYLTANVTSGPRGWGDYVGEVGVPFFRSANLNKESLEPKLGNLAHVQAPAGSEPEAARASVAVGDVLVGITGANAGWVTYVRQPQLIGAVVSQHVALIRPDPSSLDPLWLAHLLRSEGCFRQLMAMQYGGTKTQLSLPNLRDLRVPSVGVSEQRAVAQALDAEARIFDEYRQLCMTQVALAQEYKQGLITAAVTGQFDVTTGRGVA